MATPLRWLAGALVLTFAVGFLWPTGARADAAGLTPDQVRALLPVKHALDEVAELQRRGVLAPEVAETERTRLRAQALTVVGPGGNADAALADVEQYLGLLIQPPLRTPIAGGTSWFLAILWFVASVLLTVALGWLGRLYLLPLLALLPEWCYETLAYLVCAGFCVAGTFVGGENGPYVALPGCLGLWGALLYSQWRRREWLVDWLEARHIDPACAVTAIFWVAWSAMAVLLHSTMLGFLAVGALLALLGYTMTFLPMTVVIGFRERASIPRATAAAFLLLATAVIAEILGWRGLWVDVFAPGARFLGAFVYFLGLLILASRFYPRASRRDYLYLQALTIASGVAALWLGTRWDLGSLHGVGGTFFFLYLIEKYFELPWDRRSWAWAMLGLAVLLWGGAWAAREYPQYFLFAGG